LPERRRSHQDRWRDGKRHRYNGLQDAGSAALKAIEARDAEALSNAGETIDAACEHCHLKYWYPNQKKP